MIWLIVVLLVIFGALALLTQLTANAAAFNQAQAVRDVAHVAQTNANNMSWAVFAIIVLAILLVAAAIAVAYLFWRDRRREQQLADLRESGMLPQGRWAPGPNARFQRAGQSPQLPAGSGDMSQMVMALLAMRMMDQQPRPAPQQQLPPQSNNPWEI